MEKSTRLLFGPQALSWNNGAFQSLQSTVQSSERHTWILDAIAGLPNSLHKISRACPWIKAKADSTLPLLEDLQRRFRTGATSLEPLDLPNTILTPLSVISQLVQYVEHRTALCSTSSSLDGLYDASKESAEALELCTGLLSALVVSYSSRREEFEALGHVAVRLSLLVGLFVDARDEEDEQGPAKALSLIWHSDEERQSMLSILERFPKAYTSVFYDFNRATITCPTQATAAMQQELRSFGITASDIGLNGRFHWQGHSAIADALIKFCDSDEEHRFPMSSCLLIPIRSTTNGHYIISGSTTRDALTSILLEPARWYDTVFEYLSSMLSMKESKIVSFGLERCLPPSLQREVGQKLLHVADQVKKAPLPTCDGLHPALENDIAVVGMACKVAGADDLDAFWDLLCKGESQHQEVPSDRFTFDTVHRELEGRKWFGNFINGHDQFDHKFFKKSPRESQSMDPQQRQLLQISYQALQSSGYFQKSPDRHVGCFVGVCSTDYEDNVACHAPTAYSATGNLQGFIAGKVSHFFGWTGPGLTIDTACSSSLVAVHQACQAIRLGECSTAIAAGSHINTSPLWFQNLAGASFLSKTGACKPFDADADGYCRGEGVAAVYLKKLSAAVADGDQIHGVLAGSAVQQNENCTPIVVPNGPSLSGLFENVLGRARLRPEQITVAECHGTGTPVGDPAEFDSVRRVLGGPKRSSPLSLGSVKGLVGHCECTSGLISLIKILLMLKEGAIPPQASHKRLNPAINTSPADQMQILTCLSPWQAKFRAALINNYGASGSNASMVVTQAPKGGKTGLGLTPSPTPIHQDSARVPLWFAGLDDRSLRAYAAVISRYISREKRSGRNVSIADLAFSLSYQSNRSLARSLQFCCGSAGELEHLLNSYGRGDPSSNVVSADRSEPRPLILCFGGQISNYIGLDRELYENVTVLRYHLDRCDSMCITLGLGSIFPDIFQRTPIEDIVKLQACLFALQFSCAKAWIASGAQPVALVGHSFGELTSLCIAEVLSPEETLKAILTRARIIRDSWGPERGAMMAVEANLDALQQVMQNANRACTGSEPATIACYNGPTTFTIAGSHTAIDAIGDALRRTPGLAKSSKKLNVTHAFRSTLVEHVKSTVKEATKDLKFKQPKIRVARCTEQEATFSPGYFADHLRLPVFFNHAVQRLAQEFPQCIWLEAGSCSTITKMASRALSTPSGIHFQAINITNDNAWASLADSTLSLWRAGLDIGFWAHHISQSDAYARLLLPPHQFEPTRHWLERKKPPQRAPASALQAETEAAAAPETLTTFMGYEDPEKRRARFRVNTMLPEYERLMRGHTVARTAPICSATVQIDMAIESARSLLPQGSQLQPEVLDITHDAPICLNKSVSLWLDLEVSSTDKNRWTFTIITVDPLKGSVSVINTTGGIHFRSIDDPQTALEFATFERIIGHSRATELLNDPKADCAILGRTSIYKAFSEVLEYDEQYQGVDKIVGKGMASATRVVKLYNPETWFDCLLADAFCQVVGVWVNQMTASATKNIHIANGFTRWMRSAKLDREIARPKAYDVLALHSGSHDDGFVSDIFVFSADTGRLLEVILGLKFAKIPRIALVKLLNRHTEGGPTGTGSTRSADVQLIDSVEDIETTSKSSKKQLWKAAKAKAKKQRSAQPDVLTRLRPIIVELSGVDPDQITEATGLADIGVDSLLGMELIALIGREFKCTLPQDEIAAVTDVSGSVRCIQGAIGYSPEPEDSDEDSTDSVFDTPPSRTSTPSSIGTEPDLGKPSEPRPSSDLSESGPDASACNSLIIPISKIQQAFEVTKSRTDNFLHEGGCDGYLEAVLPLQNELCVALIMEALAQVDCSVGTAGPQQPIKVFESRPADKYLVRNLYQTLEKVGRLVKTEGDRIMRTDMPLPIRSSREIMRDPAMLTPEHADANKLIFYVGSHLADVLAGRSDGVKLIFGSSEGRDLVSKLYGDWTFNRTCYREMEDFLSRLISSMSPSDGAVRILEVGAGTGGTTKWLVPLLASLHHPVEYTFTDLAPSLTAAARKRYKDYPFMSFQAHDIEKEPAPNLTNKYHLVIASNAVHATHSIAGSATNLKKALVPNGVLLMNELVNPLPWVDMIFGLFEGWWLFDDGRHHAISPVSRWKTDLQASGFKYVDWTAGMRPETNVSKVIMAVACEQDLGPEADDDSDDSLVTPPPRNVDRQAMIDDFISKKTYDFCVPKDAVDTNNDGEGEVVLVTGATGSTGSHLVANLAGRAEVKTVICLNRRNCLEPKERQLAAFASKGITMGNDIVTKFWALQTDSARPKLGLEDDIYHELVRSVTRIVHAAWPMSLTRPTKGFEAQFDVMRNLIDLARDISSTHGTAVHFQFVSSIGVVGQYPVWQDTSNVPEDRVSLDAILNMGYADSKYICERMLDETLHQHPNRFRASVVRVGQIAGSKECGCWNQQEHLAFLWKSSQTLNKLPALEGLLSWTPVEDVAGALADLVLHDEPYAVYHIDNPVRQSWSGLIPVVADALGIPRRNIVPFAEWAKEVRRAPATSDNPASRLIDFLESDFVRMACGGCLLETTHTTSHSPTLRDVGPLTAEVVERFFTYWQRTGFLK